MTAPTQLVTRGGQKLTAYAWASLEAAYRDAGLDPARYLVVVQGSHKGSGGGAAASGSTHDAGDTADLRTRELPSSARADLCRGLVVALRARGWCAWYRDQQHGGMDPHIHAVYRWADPPLSSGARSQVRDYDAGRNGLDNNGPDYHPRPTQRRHPWPTTPAPNGDDDMALLIRNAKTGAVSLLSGSVCTWLSDGASVTALQQAGVKMASIAEADYARIASESR